MNKINLIKYKYIHKKHSKNKLHHFKLNKGNWALSSQTSGIITENQLNSISKILSKYLKKNMYFFRIYLNKIFSTKTIGSRMGGGKGNIAFSFVYIKPNTIILEIILSSKANAKYILKIIASKLSFKTKFIERIN